MNFLKKKKHPLNDEIQLVREIIMNVSEKIGKDIKWSSPTFIYKGNIIIDSQPGINS